MMSPNQLTSSQARHLLVRTGFTPTQSEVNAIVGQPAQRAVKQLVANAIAAKPLHPAPSFVIAAPDPRPDGTKTQEERQEYRRQQLAEGGEIKAWWLREMLETPNPLAERMVLFWHNHFATSQQKVNRSIAMWRQHMLFRTHALGSFSKLLHGVARDPAMLLYLDAANSRKEAPNENFAREVMELFTLGEATNGGGYTEQDIKEVARAFTGWSVDREDFTFKFRRVVHDADQKLIIGRSGRFDGDDALDIMLAQPACSTFMVGKLWKEFVSHTPNAIEVQRIAKSFVQSNYDISVALTELLLSSDFWEPKNRGSLIKSPVDLVVGTVRQFAFNYDDVLPFVLKTTQLGQNLLMPPNVKGWPGYTDWINSTTLLDRKRFTEQLFRSVELKADGKMMDPLRPAEQKRKELMADMRQSVRADMLQGGNVQATKRTMRAAGNEGVMRVAKAITTLSFDSDAFLAQVGAHTDREPTVEQKEAIAGILLASNATQNIANGTVGIAYLRTLSMDPAYQLK